MPKFLSNLNRMDTNLKYYDNIITIWTIWIYKLVNLYPPQKQKKIKNQNNKKYNHRKTDRPKFDNCVFMYYTYITRLWYIAHVLFTSISTKKCHIVIIALIGDIDFPIFKSILKQNSKIKFQSNWKCWKTMHVFFSLEYTLHFCVFSVGLYRFSPYLMFDWIIDLVLSVIMVCYVIRILYTAIQICRIISVIHKYGESDSKFTIRNCHRVGQFGRFTTG